MLNEAVIGRIGKWWLLGQENRPFYGQLVQKPDRLLLSTEMVCTEVYEAVGEKKNFIVHGLVGGDKVTLRGTNLEKDTTLSMQDGEIPLVGMSLVPEECFVGNQWVPEMVVVKSAYVKYDGIGAWFRKNSYQEHVPFSQDSVLLSFQQHNPLSFALDGFDLQFDFGLSYSQREWSDVQYTNWVNTVFFPKQRPLPEFCERVGQFSQFLSLFCCGEVQPASMILETTAGFNGEYLVNGPLESKELSGGFWLTYPQVASCLETALQNWFRIAVQAQPVLEILTHALTLSKPSASHFLTAVQALELYSNYFRAAQAKQYAQRVSDLPEGETAPVELNHKLCDLLENAGTVLGFSQVELWKIANKIASSFTYYLHYNPSKKYDALTKAQLQSLLTVAKEVLKVCLLKEIGVSDEVLGQAGIDQVCRDAVYACILKAPQISQEPVPELPKIY